MARFTKYNNPAKKKKKTAKRSPFSAAYIEERRQELNQLLAKAQSDSEREFIKKAFDISIYN